MKVTDYATDYVTDYAIPNRQKALENDNRDHNYISIVSE